ncbi:MAG: hypothetical protein RJB06_747, partial [Pseudomonadota bacterium]
MTVGNLHVSAVLTAHLKQGVGNLT